MKKTMRYLMVSFLGLWSATLTGAPLGTGFNYQGRLAAANQLASGRYDFAFRLLDATNSGNQYGPILTNVGVLLTNGLFSANLDFGAGIFSGQALWLEVSVRTNGTGAFTVLQPRQPVSATPYALYALQAQSVENASIANPIFLGTTDQSALELSVGQQRALRLEPTGGAPNLIGGASVNSVQTGVAGATIAGGGESGAAQYIGADYGAIGGGAANQTYGVYATVAGGFDNYASGYGSSQGGGLHNTVTNDYGYVGGGLGNFVGGMLSGIGSGGSNTVLADYSAVAGGWQNYVEGSPGYGFVGGGWLHYLAGDSAVIGGGGYNSADSDYTFVGGGTNNAASATAASIVGGQDNIANGDYAAVGGGAENAAYGILSTVAGGYYNYALDYGTVAGGQDNMATGTYATVAGGVTNTASGSGATVGGGGTNRATSAFATVAGGQHNQAGGVNSFAAGAGANAAHANSFVWSDFYANRSGTLLTTSSSTTNEFTVRALGGARFISAVDTTSGVPTAGVKLTPGSGTWANLSDRNAKENFTPVQGKEILEKVAALPIAAWNYKTQDKSVRHLGPMAQDFSAAFHLGDDDISITTVDSAGVALAAIQGLNQVVKEKDAEIQALQKRMAALEKMVSQLAAQRSEAGDQPAPVLK